MNRVSRYVVREWESDPLNFVSLLALVIVALANGIATQWPFLDDIFKKSNVYQASAWVIVPLILYQLRKISRGQDELGKRTSSFCHVRDIGDVAYKYRTADAVTIYCGSENRDIWNKIANMRGIEISKLSLYIRPGRLESVLEPTFSSMEYKIHYADIPNGYMLASGHQSDGTLLMCDLVVQDSQDGGYWKLDLSADKNQARIFINLFESAAQSTGVPLKDYLALGIFTFITRKHLHDQDSLLRQRKVNLRSRVDFFDLATDLVKVSKLSLIAVDFFKPKHWLSDPSARKYGEAHAVNIATKKRIHIYKHEEAKLAVNDYRAYVEFMEQRNVELLFLDEKLFDTAIYEKRGSLIIDESCVVVAINPSEGAAFGEIDFNPNIVESYKKRFFDLESVAQNFSLFLSLIGENS